MQLKFKDFAPSVTRKKAIIGSLIHTGPLRDTVKAANDWIKDADVNVINVETVVMPNMYARGAAGTKATQVNVFGGDAGGGQWYQFVRVWYVGPARVKKRKTKAAKKRSAESKSVDG